MHKQILELTEDYVRAIIASKIPPKIYHNLAHTEDVVNSSIEIGVGEHLASDELELIQIAAWFHDLGYFEKQAGHERVSVVYARNFLLDNHYHADKIEKIAGCILSTNFPQKPHNKLEEIICDADLSYLGRRSFFERNDLFRNELEHYSNSKLSEIEWLTKTINFLNQHHFFTDYALKNFNPQKEKNISVLKEQLEKSQFNPNNIYPNQR